VFSSDDVVFAWAFGKALLIVIVSFGALVYTAWAATRQKSGKNAAQAKARSDHSVDAAFQTSRDLSEEEVSRWRISSETEARSVVGQGQTEVLLGN
jgi:hypothetical protein